MNELLVSRNGRPIGECIYCGATTNLSTEHAVPYAINGPWTLLDASCPDCCDITHRFERDMLRGLFPAIRTVFNMQTRRRKERPTTLPLLVVRHGVDQFIDVPVKDFPVFLPLIELPPPGVVAGRRLVSGIGPPVLDVRHLAGPGREELTAMFPDADYIGARMTFAPEDFGRTLAKIGFCAAVFALGLAPFRNTPITGVILGHDKSIGHWVGSWIGEEQNPPNGLHGMKVRAAGADIHVILRLFAQFGASEYHVALGPAAPEFVSSPDWPWK
jgi:hypothetical protein